MAPPVYRCALMAKVFDSRETSVHFTFTLKIYWFIWFCSQYRYWRLFKCARYCLTSCTTTEYWAIIVKFSSRCFFLFVSSASFIINASVARQPHRIVNSVHLTSLMLLNEPLRTSVQRPSVFQRGMVHYCSERFTCNVRLRRLQCRSALHISTFVCRKSCIRIFRISWIILNTATASSTMCQKSRAICANVQPSEPSSRTTREWQVCLCFRRSY